jgi:hypothetical protein
MLRTYRNIIKAVPLAFEGTSDATTAQEGILALTGKCPLDSNAQMSLQIPSFVFTPTRQQLQKALQNRAQIYITLL